jgi:hypothetical protein
MSLDQFFKSLSKTTLAALAIGGGIFLIILMDPPHTLCDAQMDVFKKNQQGFLYVNPKNKSEKTTRAEKFLNQCKLSNNPGGCYEYFVQMRGLLRDAQTVPEECTSTLAGQRAFREAIYEATTLLVQVAWGEKPPTSYFEKFGWLNAADISLFCNLKSTFNLMYGKSEWEQFQEKLMASYPGVETLDRKATWEMSLLSVNCAEYP